MCCFMVIPYIYIYVYSVDASISRRYFHFLCLIRKTLSFHICKMNLKWGTYGLDSIFYKVPILYLENSNIYIYIY